MSEIVEAEVGETLRTRVQSYASVVLVASTESYLIGYSAMAADLKGFLSNCFVGGESGNVRSGRRWVKDSIDLRFGGREVSIVQKPEALIVGPSKYNGVFVETTTVVVREVRAEERDEVRELLATLFILLENLKSTFAKEQGFQFDGRNYLKPSGRPWTFSGLLSEMVKWVGMRQPDLSPIVDLRNEIIHSGASETSFEHQNQIYENGQDIAREYILRSWGYSGEFQLYGGRGMTTKRICPLRGNQP